jgi:hypothetical protein
MYLAGYSIEGGFKALILTRTPQNQRAETLEDISSGQESHNFEHLGDLLKKRGCELPLEITVRMRAVAKAKWRTGWRYEVGIKPFREAKAFLDHTEAFLDWVERSL